MSNTTKPAQRAGAPRRQPHDRTKMRFEGQTHGKGRLVLAVVQSYVRQHPNITSADLSKQFDGIHSLGVVQPVSVAKKKSAKHRRFFLAQDELIKLKDRTVAVCSDFGKETLDRFLTKVQPMGFRPRRVSA